MGGKLRLGILSTGNIARQFAAGVRQSENCLLQAVGSRSAESAQAFAQGQQVATAWGSYEQLLADPNVDAVYIALPNSLHHQWTLKALRAGKHVLCEKPFATNLAEAQEMFAVAKSTGRVLVEAFMYRSHPQTLKILETVRGGAIGIPRLIRVSFNYKTSRINDNIRFDPDLAGGARMDIGCYCIDFAQLIAGCEPQACTAYGRLHESGVDELAAGVLQFPNGILASFTCGMTAPANNAAQICGTEGYIEIPIPWKPPVNNAGFTIAYGVPPKMDQLKDNARPVGPQFVKVEASRDLYAYEADDFAATVLQHKPPRMTREATLANMRILEDLLRQIGVRG